MNRTLKFKILYIFVLIFFLIGLILIIKKFQFNFTVHIGVIIFLLLPGRITGIFWRDFFRGRNLLTQEKFHDAIPYFEDFLLKLKNKPWLKKFMISFWGFYTRDIEVMTLNNLGVANLEIGKIELASEYFKEAISKDEKCPMPYYNIAIIEEMAGDREMAIKSLNESIKLGYKATITHIGLDKSFAIGYS